MAPKVAPPPNASEPRGEWEKRRDLEAAERMDGLVSRLDLEEQILDHAEENVEKIPPKDLANAYKNLAIGSGVLQDKSDRIKGKPAEVVHHQIDLTTVRKAIAALEAQQLEEEITDAEVMEADP